jgi:hypothetical protein
MIAVVDGQPECRLEIRAAPPAGMTREFVHDDRAAATEASQRSRQSGKTGADDVNCSARHHATP